MAGQSRETKARQRNLPNNLDCRLEAGGTPSPSGRLRDRRFCLEFKR